MSLKSRCQSISGAFGEAIICLALAVRSSLDPGVLMRSCGLCLLTFGLLILLIAPLPFINLLLPALLGAGSCHLACRGLLRAGLPAGAPETPQVSLPPP